MSLSTLPVYQATASVMIETSNRAQRIIYNLKYKYSSDYDLFYRMIVKFKMKGMATKKEEIFGEFRILF